MAGQVVVLGRDIRKVLMAQTEIMQVTAVKARPLRLEAVVVKGAAGMAEDGVDLAGMGMAVVVVVAAGLMQMLVLEETAQPALQASS